MAQKVQVLLVDDIDGGTADETVTFALDGVSYEIDLTTDHARELRDGFGHWVGHARKVSGLSVGRPARGGTARRSGGSGDATAIREWARANGRSVSERGRISAEIKAAYGAAH
jgi:Lsr2